MQWGSRPLIRRTTVGREVLPMSDIPGGGGIGAGPVAKVDDATKVRSVPIKVNGITIEVIETVSIREILTQARDTGAIEGSVEGYVIERVEKEGELGIEETIRVTEFEEFLAVPTGKTDVAYAIQVCSTGEII